MIINWRLNALILVRNLDLDITSASFYGHFYEKIIEAYYKQTLYVLKTFHSCCSLPTSSGQNILFCKLDEKKKNNELQSPRPRVEFLLIPFFSKVLHSQITEAVNCTVFVVAPFLCQPSEPGCTGTHHFLILQLQKHADCHFKKLAYRHTNKASPHDSIAHPPRLFPHPPTGELRLSFLFFLSSILTL